MLGITNLRALIKKSLDEQVNDLPRTTPNAHTLKTTGYDARAVVLDAILVFLFLSKVYPTVAKKVKKAASPLTAAFILVLVFFILSHTPLAAANVQAGTSTNQLPVISESIKTNAAPLFKWPVGGYISQHFWFGHRAVDLPNPIGTAVQPVAEGVVIFAGWEKDGYGNSIVIQHADGFSSRYAHLSKIFVKVGSKVDSKTIIADTGASGQVTGPHLHFELLWYGVQVDPEKFLPPFK